MGRNNADFEGIYYEYQQDSEGDHNVVAIHPKEDEPVGYLTWADRDYEEGAQRGHIMDVHVAPEHQRKGIATGMLNYAKAISSSVGAPQPTHAESRTISGDAWAKSTSGYYPPHEIVNY